jgi:glycosyltransferase involved in cell wall biosynthesis
VFRRALRRERFDLIHLHYPHRYGVFLEDIADYPFVVSAWGSEILPMVPEPDSDKAIKVSYLRRATRVVALSNFLAEAIAQYAGLDRTRIVMQYWGVDLTQFTPGSTPCHDPIIGFAKALSRQYGAEYLIDALPRILNVVPEARLLMLGTGELENTLRERAHQLRVGHRIEWVGEVDHSRMPQQFARMALSVMPSVYPSETLGVAALESQAMQVPVVASRIGGVPESVIDGETGILVPARNSDSLADAIVTLLANSDLRRWMGRQGRAHVERRFDWRCTLEDMSTLYRSVVTSK